MNSYEQEKKIFAYRHSTNPTWNNSIEKTTGERWNHLEFKAEWPYDLPLNVYLLNGGNDFKCYIDNFSIMSTHGP